MGNAKLHMSKSQGTCRDEVERRPAARLRPSASFGAFLLAIRSSQVLIRALWVAALVLAVAPVCGVAQDSWVPEVDPAEAIESGRKALRGRTYYPWYDAESDRVRRVNVTPPKRPPPPTKPNWNWPEWKGWNFNWSIGDIFWTTLQVIFWGVILALFVFLIVLLTKVFLGREAAGAVSSEDELHIETGAADRIEHLPFEVRRPQGDLLAEAQRFYEQGDYQQAIVYYFSYLLVELDRGQVIRLTRGKTNRQYLREVRRQRQEVAGLVERTMVAFEDVFFGDHALDRERFESCWNGRDEFQRQLQQPA